MIYSPDDVTAVRQPIDTIENKEKKGRDDQEESVHIDVVVTAEVLHWLLKSQHVVRIVLSIRRTYFVLVIVFTNNLKFRRN